MEKGRLFKRSWYRVGLKIIRKWENNKEIHCRRQVTNELWRHGMTTFGCVEKRKHTRFCLFMLDFLSRTKRSPGSERQSDKSARSSHLWFPLKQTSIIPLEQNNFHWSRPSILLTGADLPYSPLEQTIHTLHLSRQSKLSTGSYHTNCNLHSLH
jgi:hypothetical protein